MPLRAVRAVRAAPHNVKTPTEASANHIAILGNIRVDVQTYFIDYPSLREAWEFAPLAEIANLMAQLVSAAVIGPINLGINCWSAVYSGKAERTSL